MSADGREIVAEERTETEEKDAPSLSPSTSGEDVYLYSGKNMECRKDSMQTARIPPVGENFPVESMAL